MALGVEDVPAGRVIWKTALLTLGTVGFVFCLTLMFDAMRAVMDVGGTCASGGPFKIRQECPEGTAWMFPAAIFGGLASLGIGAIGMFRQGGPRPFAFAWSALFLALGWNFLDYAFDPPGGGGLEWGWLVCGVVFVLMGGLPLLFLLSPTGVRTTLWGPSSKAREAPARTQRGSSSSRTPSRASATTGVTVAAPAPTGPTTTTRATTTRSPRTTDDRRSDAEGDIVGRLERLAALKDRGAIDAEEYERAKDMILREVGR
jgi:hypothetical protein